MDVQGPVLSDREFFATLDYSIEGLSKVEELKEAERYGEARAEFAKYVRATLDVEKFYSLPNKVRKPDLTPELKEAARKALDHEMCSVGTPMKFEGTVDWTANPTYNGYKEWTWQLSRHSEVTALANAYRASGDEKYAEGAVELLISWIRQALPPPLTESGYHTLLWRTIECGIRMFNWPNIILSLIHSPHFTDGVLIDVFKSLYEHAEQLMHRFTANNWLLMEINGLIHIALVYPVFKDRGVWLKTVTERALKEIDLQVHPDGMQFELTTGYQGVVISNFMQLGELAEYYGSPLPRVFFDKLEGLVEAYIKLMQSDGRLPNINDGSHGFAKDLVKRYVHAYPDNPRFKWLLTDGKEGEAPEYTSIILEYSGLAVLRSGFDSTDVSVFFDAGKFGKGHQHEDKLNVTLCNGEKTVLCEAQTYAYDSSDMRKYVLSSFGHNTVTVNGVGQARRPHYKWQEEFISIPEDIDCYLSPECDFLKGRYDEHYGSGTPARHERSVIFVKKTKLGRPFLAVVDRLFPKDSPENDYTAMWHFDTSEVKITDFGAVCPEMKIFTFGEDERTVVKGQTEPRVQGFICRASRQGCYEPIPTLLCTAHGGEVELAALFSLGGDGENPIDKVFYSDGSFTVTYTNGEVDTVSEKELFKKSKKASLLRQQKPN